MILVNPSVSVTGVGSPGASTDRALATWNGTSGADLRSNSTLLISSSGTLDSSGADIRFLDQTFHIGVTKNQTSGTDYRPSRVFTKDAVIVGSLGTAGAPYGVNNALVTGMAAFGNLAACYPIVGANTLMNSVSMGYFAWTKDTSFLNLPAFYNLNASATDFDVYFATIHRTTAKEDLLKFGGNGSFTFLKSSGAHLLWNTDGAGSVGKLSEGVAEVTQVVCVADVANSLRGTSFTINIPGTDYYVWYKTSGVGSDPGFVGTGIMVDVPTGSTAAAIATATETAMELTGDFSVSVVSATMTITNSTPGAVLDASDIDSGFTISTPTQGEDEFQPVNRPEAIYAKTLVRLGQNTLYNYGPDGWAPDTALEMSREGSAIVGYASASENQFRVGVFGQTQNDFIYWDSTLPGVLQVRNTAAALSTSWLWFDNSSPGGVDTQAIIFKDTGRIIWETDGAGDIGSLDGGTTPNRPNNVFVKTNIEAGGKVLTTGGLGVGNSASGSSLGTVSKKIEVFDASGASLGYIPVYDAIT